MFFPEFEFGYSIRSKYISTQVSNSLTLFLKKIKIMLIAHCRLRLAPTLQRIKKYLVHLFSTIY